MLGRTTRWTIAAALAISLTGCGEKKDKPAGQSLARVNGADITVHQVNLELQRLGPQGGATDAGLQRRLLDDLIDQQLLVQRALEDKLERDPQVVQMLDQARRQVLSQVWLDRKVSAARPDAAAISAFYGKHPDLFQKRKVYSFRDFVIERGRLDDALRERLDKAKTPADVIAILKAQSIPFREASSVRPAEQLPLDALPRVATMVRGDLLVIVEGQMALLLQVVEAVDQPVPLDRATPYIEQYIVNAKRRGEAAAKIKELRATAKIEYLGGGGPSKAVDAAAGRAADATTHPAAPVSTPVVPGAAGTDTDFLQKGVQGLR